MLSLSATTRILVAREDVSFLGGIDHLVGICRRVMVDEPMSGTAFVFAIVVTRWCGCYFTTGRVSTFLPSGFQRAAFAIGFLESGVNWLCGNWRF